MRLLICGAFVILLSFTANAQLDKFGLRDGQAYEKVKKLLAKHGFKPVKHNQELSKVTIDPKNPGIECGQLRTGRQACIGAFENAKEDFFVLDFKRDSKGRYLLIDSGN